MSKSDERLANEWLNEAPEVKTIDPAVSRRNFLKGSGLALSLPLLAGESAEAAATNSLGVPILGPEKVAITLMVNGQPLKATVEPRVTLLDCLRNDLDTTGAKRVCDRGTCGACTVQMNGKAVYACSVLAIEAQGRKITTVLKGRLDAGNYSREWSGLDSRGKSVGAGMYFYKLRVNDEVRTVRGIKLN